MILLQSMKNPRAMSHNLRMEMEEWACKRILKTTLHFLGEPMKVSTFLWLFLSEGLPTSQWLRKIRIGEKCRLCTMGVMDSNKHMLYDFEGFVRFGIFFKQMMVEKGLGEVLGDIEQVLLRVSILCLAIANGQGGVVGINEVALP